MRSLCSLLGLLVVAAGLAAVASKKTLTEPPARPRDPGRSLIPRGRLLMMTGHDFHVRFSLN